MHTLDFLTAKSKFSTLELFENGKIQKL